MSNVGLVEKSFPTRLSVRLAPGIRAEASKRGLLERRFAYERAANSERPPLFLAGSRAEGRFQRKDPGLQICPLVSAWVESSSLTPRTAQLLHEPAASGSAHPKEILAGVSKGQSSRSPRS